MTRTRRQAIVLIVTLGVAGCGGTGAPSPSPNAPTPVPQPTAVSLVVFRDSATAFSTTDVRDMQDQIVQINTADELIWAADGKRFPGYRAIGNFVRWDSYYEVVFVTRAGERRAYLTTHGHGATDPNRICDIEVVGGQLVINETNVPLCSPQSSGPC
jgi:hypothetical protein